MHRRPPTPAYRQSASDALAGRWSCAQRQRAGGHVAGKPWWRGCIFRLLTKFGWYGRWVDHLEFGFDCGHVGIEQLVEQTALIRTQLLAALGELMPFEHGDIEGELFVTRLKTMGFLAHGIDLGALPQGVFGPGEKRFRGHLVKLPAR